MGFAPLHFWPLSLICFAAWMALVYPQQRARTVFGLSWAFGLGHFTLGLNWIATAFTYQAAMPAWLGWIAVVLLSIYLAIYPALAGQIAWLIGAKGRQLQSRLFPLSYLLAFAGAWTFTEWLRSWVFTGFAWNPLSAITVPSAAAPVRFIGTYGTSALVILAAALLMLLAVRRWKMAAGLGVWLAAISGISLLGLLQDESAASLTEKRPTTPLVTIVQPNIDQAEKWEGEYAALNFQKLASLTTSNTTTPRLILWPEASIPDYLERGYPAYYYDLPPHLARQRLTQLMNPNDMLLLGALKLEFDDQANAIGARNAVMSLYADGSLGPRYDKSHLVPYGEYLPMRPLLSAMGLSRLAPGDLDFWPGPGPRTIDLLRFGKIGLQICYEIIFSGQVVDRENRPNFLFNPSNDAWFGAWGPPQHLAQARLRAIEEGLPVLRSTPTGISAIITPSGQIKAAIPAHEAGRIDAHIPAAYAPTFFARHGNAAALGFALLLIVAAIAFRKKRD